MWVTAMLKKSFVSLSFSSSKRLQVLKLDSSQKRVKKFLSIDLPDGLIHNMRVQDEAALAKILKETWKKLGLREKSVGIVVPESSTFTKMLTLPTLPWEELDEAVRWQALDFLPTKPSGLVLDWKTIKKEEGSCQILVVAIIKEVLQGYVRSASLAGLFPLVVETPSISLVRISDGEDKGRLILYETFGEAVLIVAQGEKIIGSSVVKIDDHEEVTRVSTRMLKHYRGVEVERVVIGGPKISQEMAKKLQTDLGKPVSWIKPTVTGLNALQFQEYLIPISLQLKDPAEPADETTINLLPSDLVKKYEHQRLKEQIRSLNLLATLIIWICSFTTLGVYLFLGQQTTSYKSVDVSKKISPEKAQAIRQIEEINGTSNKVLAITKVSKPLQLIFNAISEARSEGISILKYKIDLDTGNIDLIGISSTRQALIDFKRSLEEFKDFSLVQMPITSFEKETDLEYSLRFKYLPVISKGISK